VAKKLLGKKVDWKKVDRTSYEKVLHLFGLYENVRRTKEEDKLRDLEGLEDLESLP
jgi:hypothetical protein